LLFYDRILYLTELLEEFQLISREVRINCLDPTLNTSNPTGNVCGNTTNFNKLTVCRVLSAFHPVLALFAFSHTTS
jgi:hypothetical protein